RGTERRARPPPRRQRGAPLRLRHLSMPDLSGRVVVVTGGNAGIGLGIARGVARAGADVAGWARNEERNERAVDELRALGVRALGVGCDVTDEGQVDHALVATVDGLGQLDALFANAGTYG